MEPQSRLRRYRDLYGNPCTRVVLPAGRSALRYDAVVLVADAAEDADEHARELPPDDLPDEVLLYTLPSRYCLPDMLGDEAWSRFGGMPPGYPRVRAICDHVHDHLTFSYGSSGPWSTAVDVNTSGFGVCRDFTHLAISFCRAMNLPARYVFGYLPAMDVPPDPAPTDFAAWMEVWLGDRWWTFDPRNNRRRKGRILSAGDATRPTSPWSPRSAGRYWTPCRYTRRRSRPDDAAAAVGPCCYRYWPEVSLSVLATRTDTTLDRLMTTPLSPVSRSYLARVRTRLRRSSRARAIASSASCSPAKSLLSSATSCPPTGWNRMISSMFSAIAWLPSGETRPSECVATTSPWP